MKYVTKSLTVTLFDGTKKRLKFRGKTEKEALAKMKEYEIKMAAGLIATGGDVKYSVWAEEWLTTFYHPHATDWATGSTEVVIRRHILPHIGELKLSAITPAHIQRIANAMSSYSASAINRTKHVLSQTLRVARANGKTTNDPMALVRWPKGHTKARRAMTTEEKDIFLSICEANPAFWIFLPSFYCGLRPAEVMALTWSNVSLDKNELTVSQAVKAGKEGIGGPKSSAGNRTLVIPSALAEILRKIPKTSIYVFPASNGEYYERAEYSRLWGKLKKAMIARVPSGFRPSGLADIEDLTPYYLRHTFASMLVQSGTNIKTIQYFLGHSEVTLTLNVYAHFTSAMMEDAKGTIDAMFSGVSPECPSSEVKKTTAQ